ncbi:hypothetical protein [Paenibacillus luteus]|uniref:hypothetical protein n=1 Tax=Paenibacillus luteus TaxID=2545753 RepID=UPI001F4FEF76|nr:hypothetical protein [Paenibacillus luteus]
MSVIVRDCTLEDIDGIAFLMGELGYPTSYEEMKGRFKNPTFMKKMASMCLSLPWWYTVILEVKG